MYLEQLDDIIASVIKPTRYLGNEWNSIHKDLKDVEIRIALAFPDVYEVGMSHLGIKILYHLLNQQKGVYAERVFAPWVDMEKRMKENKIPLFSLETHSPIKEFDFIGFTLQYELSYTNIINMLDMSGIPLYSSERTEEHPFVIAGGPCAFNPEPLAEFIDFFVIGEGEEVILEIIEIYKEWKKNGGTRNDFLKKMTSIKGIYIPGFYEVEYNSEKTIEKVRPKIKEAPRKITKRIIKDFEDVFYPTRFIVPYMDIVHDRAALEIFRGCTRGCRFCQAGMIYRPVREKSVERLSDLANEIVNSTGFEELSLVSLSTSDYPFLQELVEKLTDRFRGMGVNLSLPSLRVDSFSLKLAEELQTVRKSGLTFAPEAGSQRLRDVINKGVTENDLKESLTAAFEAGWKTVKLYFMIGLPTETEADLEGIASLAEKVVFLYRKVNNGSKKGLKVTVSTSSFVPKPFTPFQWEAQNPLNQLKAKQKYLKDRIKDRAVRYNWHEATASHLEAVFARGDRRLCKVLVKAWEKGCKFDGWSEHFKFDKWMEAFRECNVDPEFYANRKREYDEVLPWDHIDAGIDKNFLIREHKKALKGELTEDCRFNRCSACGIFRIDGGNYCVNPNKVC